MFKAALSKIFDKIRVENQQYQNEITLTLYNSLIFSLNFELEKVHLYQILRIKYVRKNTHYFVNLNLSNRFHRDLNNARIY